MGNYQTTDNTKQDNASLPAGINLNIDAEQYHRTLGLTKSGLMALKKSPAHFWQWMTSSSEPSTQAMNLGTATHTLVFEPDKWEKEIVVIPEDAPKKPTAAQVKAKKPSEEALASTKWWAEFNKAAENKCIITQDQLIQAQGMAAAVHNYTDIEPLLNHPSAKAELSIMANEEVNGLQIACKMRCDLLTEDGKTIVDLKTCEDASPEGFSKSFMSLGYWMQAAHYIAVARRAGLPVERFVFVAVEKHLPYSVCLYELDADSLSKAFSIRQRLLETLANCIATGEYPSYSRGTHRLTMPHWIQ